MMRLFDTHSHIHDKDFDADRDAIIGRAEHDGLIGIITLGVTAENSERALALSRRHSLVWAAAGVHPHDAAEATDGDLDALEAIARDPRVVAVGEIGLDFYRNLSPRDRQTAVFRRQLDTSARVGKPVAVHARDAHDEMLPLLESWSRAMGGRLPDGRPLGVMHYFSADAALAAAYLKLGFMISVHTSVTHPKAAMLAEVVRETPLQYLVLETDSPYGAPQRFRGKRNEPAYVAEASTRVAELKGVPVETVADTTTNNALRLFGIPPSASPSTAKGASA
ncbi:MAG: TatD family hydrolase [Chloroflexi bacterium]|nr:TatD family hydrolase [Chloroflexota bacterium]